MRIHIASWLQRLANHVGGETGGETADAGPFAKPSIGETAEPGPLAKQKIGETWDETEGETAPPHRSKEAERSARRRAVNPEDYRRQHRIYSAKSKRKVKLKKVEAAFRAEAAEQEKVATLIAKLMDDMAKEDGLRVR